MKILLLSMANATDKNNVKCEENVVIWKADEIEHMISKASFDSDTPPPPTVLYNSKGGYIKLYGFEWDDDMILEALSSISNSSEIIFTKIIFDECFVDNNECIISDITRLFGAGVIIMNLFPFDYITTMEDTNLSFDIDYIFTSACIFNILYIHEMKSSEIPLFLLKLKHGLLVTMDYDTKNYILINQVIFTESTKLTVDEKKYLEEQIKKSILYYTPIVNMLNKNV